MSAVEPLLDLLDGSADRSIRARTLRLLVSLGPTVAPAASARLANAPWYVQRNLLVLLRMLKVWPHGFSAVTYALHPELRLRREAYKLLLEFPAAPRLGDHPRPRATPTMPSWHLVLRAALEQLPSRGASAPSSGS